MKLRRLALDMTLRRLAIDAGIVVILVAATVAYVREPNWTYFSAGEKDIIKFGGAAVWHAELTRWWIASAVGMAAMLVRSWLPVVALAGAVAMSLAHTASIIVPFLPLDAAAVIAAFSLAAGPTHRAVRTTALSTTLALSFVPAWWDDYIPAIGPGGLALVPPAAIGLAWFFGDRTRIQRERVAQRASELERERDEQAAAERSRLARELHDAVAHGLSIIVIQAQAAGGSMDKRSIEDPTVRTALDAIETTGRDSLTEMRRLLGLDRPGEAEFAPLPGPADLPALVNRVTAAGLPVQLTITGDLTTLPTGVGLSTYRIIQEALTNALKHAGPHATVHIAICQQADAVELTVADTGRGTGGAADERRGSGLRGMRERVVLLGGTFSAEDRDVGGFEVRAHLPMVATP